LRRLLVSSVVLAALVLTGSALATYTPHLVVTQTGTATKVHLTIAKEDDATAALVIYSPASAAATLGQAVGTQIGTVTAQVNAKAISPDAVLPLTGTVVVGNPADPTIAAQAAACTQTTTPHAATWLLVLTAAGQTLNVPAFVDPTSGAEAALGASRIMVCLPSPDVPVSAGGAQFGAKLLDVNFTVNGVYAASAAPISAWLGTFVPYTAGTATPNPAGKVSAVGVMATPTVTLHANPSPGHRVVFSGRASAGGVPVANQAVAIYARARNVARTKTGALGAYKTVATLKKGVYSLRAKLTAGDTDVTAQACALVPAAAAPLIGSCVSATAAGGTFFSKPLTARVR
jgi:hypothetical protein